MCECKQDKQNYLSQPQAVSQQSAFINYLHYVQPTVITHSEQIGENKLIGETRYTEWNKPFNNLNFPFGK